MFDLVAIQGSGGDPDPSAAHPIEIGDVVVVRGDRGAVDEWAADVGLEPGAGPSVPDELLLTGEHGLAEIVVAPRSDLAGLSMSPGMVTPSEQLVVLAIQRNGYDLGHEPTVLAIGDSLIVQGTWEAIEDNTAGRDVLLVDAPDMIRAPERAVRQAAPQAVTIMTLMVVLLATGLVSAAVAGMVAAAAMVLFRVVDVNQAYRSISWTTVILVGGMIPLSSAMQQTGAAEQLAEGLVALVGDGRPYLLLAGLFVLTAVLGQLISNTATALVLVPIAASAALETGVSERPLLMGVGVAAAASFLTPVATPANLMVMGSGRLQVQRLLEARDRHDAVVLRRGDGRGTPGLAILSGPGPARHRGSPSTRRRRCRSTQIG